jgi:hypothetical protein
MGNTEATHYILSLAEPKDAETGHYPVEYAAETIDALVTLKSAQTSLYGLGTDVKLDALGMSRSPVANSDLLVHCGTQYVISNVQQMWWPDSASLLVKRLILGDLDAETGWYERIYLDLTMDGFILPKSALPQLIGLGLHTASVLFGLILGPIRDGDIVYGADTATYYVVSNVQQVPYLNSFLGYFCSLEVVPVGYLP